MFGLSFTVKDLIRSAWVFAASFAAVFTTTQKLDRAALVAAIAAGVIAVKNLVLADGTTLKG